jgi:hypothetical protein
MASSYDRRGGNHDWSNYIRREGTAASMMKTEGPGCITRIWTADPQKGTVRILIDGEVAIECPFSELFSRLPLSFGVGGEGEEHAERSLRERLPMGHTSYCPIPFDKHCWILIDPEDDYLYYHFNFNLYPPGTHVQSFDPRTSPQAPEIKKAEEVWAKWERGEPFLSWDGVPTKTYEIPPGGEAELFAREGKGVIRGIRISAPKEEHVKDNLWLVAHVDDDEPRDPSVRAPVGPMFLDYGHEIPPRSLLVGTDAEGMYYCFYPMPYYQRARVRLVNKSVLPVSARVQVLTEDTVEDGLNRFRATWHIEMPFGPDHRDYEGVACRILNLDGRDNYEMLNARGSGHFVGCGFHVDLRDAPTDRAAGEGDEMFFVDDDPRYTLYGTGTEDYVNDAWGIRGYVGPMSGSGIAGAWGADVGPQIFGYRLHLADPVPFLRKGRFTLEHGTGNNCSGLYRSVAYWYMEPGINRTKTEEARWELIRLGKRVLNDPADP